MCRQEPIIIKRLENIFDLKYVSSRVIIYLTITYNYRVTFDIFKPTFIVNSWTLNNWRTWTDTRIETGMRRELTQGFPGVLNFKYITVYLERNTFQIPEIPRKYVRKTLTLIIYYNCMKIQGHSKFNPFEWWSSFHLSFVKWILNVFAMLWRLNYYCLFFILIKYS